MNLKLLVIALALLISVPVFAQAGSTSEPEEPVITTDAIDEAAGDADDQAAPSTDQEVEPEVPSAEELAGRIESISEAFTEARNTLDALNRLRITGYIQAQYVQSDASTDTLTGTGATSGNLDTFSVRRGRVAFQYQFLPTSRLVLQPDFTGAGVALRDAYVELTEPWTTWRNTLTAGQFKVPFGFEVRQSSRDREMPERTLVIRTLFPGERDRGAMLNGTGLLERFNYRIGVVNGNGTAQATDLNKRKDVVGRVGANLGPFDVGVSGYRGREIVPVTTSPLRQGEFDKDRYGIDAQWITPVEGLGVRGEYITGTQPPNPNQGATATDADVDGWYLGVIQNLGTRHQFVFRIDEFDPNTDVGNNATRTIGGSYIFHWDANSKIMFAYEQPKRESADPDDDVFTLRYQFAF